MKQNSAAHYALKHTQQTLSPEIVTALKKKAVAGRISCAAVHAIATSFKLSPSVVGVQADLLEIRLTRCILGLFGYEREKQGTRKNLDQHVSISPQLEEAIVQQAKDNRLSCLECWDIAKNLNMRRSHVSSACEKMGIKIKPCQLGAF